MEPDYNEEQLINELARVPEKLRVVYAATCAERFFPAYERYLKQSGKKYEVNLKDHMERLWLDLCGNTMSDSEIDDAIDECMTVIQEINDSKWSSGSEAADCAATSLCYAFRCRKTGDPQEAAWAVRRVYDGLDNLIINQENIDTNQPGGESKVLAHPLMQAELARQRRDLHELLEFRGEDISELAVRLRKRAEAEAHTLFGSE